MTRSTNPARTIVVLAVTVGLLSPAAQAKSLINPPANGPRAVTTAIAGPRALAVPTANSVRPVGSGLIDALQAQAARAAFAQRQALKAAEAKRRAEAEEAERAAAAQALFDRIAKNLAKAADSFKALLDSFSLV